MSETPQLNKSGTARRVGLSRLNKSRNLKSPIAAEKTPVKGNIESSERKLSDSSKKYSQKSWKTTKITPKKPVLGRKIGRLSPVNLLRQQNKAQTPTKNEDLLEINVELVKNELPSPLASPIAKEKPKNLPDFVDLCSSQGSNGSSGPIESVFDDESVVNSTKIDETVKENLEIDEISKENLQIDVTPAQKIPSNDAKSEKLRKKYRLSLTITPDRHQELRKRRSDLIEATSTPKRQKLTDEEKICTFHKIFDLTGSSSDDDDNDEFEDFSMENLKKELETKQKLAETLRNLKKSNEQTSILIKKWTEAGILALQELSATKDPPLDIGWILDHLEIPHEIYKYRRELEQFD